jgi:hypothetical protein
MSAMPSNLPTYTSQPLSTIGQRGGEWKRATRRSSLPRNATTRPIDASRSKANAAQGGISRAGQVATAWERLENA